MKLENLAEGAKKRMTNSRDLRAAATFCGAADLTLGFVMEDAVAVAGAAVGSTN